MINQIKNYISDLRNRYARAEDAVARASDKLQEAAGAAGMLEERISALENKNEQQLRAYNSLKTEHARYKSLDEEVKKAKAGNEKIREELKNLEGRSLVERVFGTVAETAPYAAFFLGWLFNDKYSLSKAAEKIEPMHPELSYLAAEKIEDAECKQKYVDKTVEKRSGLWSWLFYKMAGNKFGELKAAAKLAQEHPLLGYAAVAVYA